MSKRSRTSRTGRARLGARAVLTLTMVVAGGLVADTTPAAATAETGADPYTLSDVGPQSTQWRMDYTYDQGTSATCQAGLGGDGWSCTTASPNVIKHAAASDAVSVWSEVTSMAIDLYVSSNGSGTGSMQWRHGDRADCFPPPTHPGWCGYPGGANSLSYPGSQDDWDTYTFYDGGYWYMAGAYNYGWFAGGCWCNGNVADVPSDFLKDTYPYQGLGHCRNCGLSMPTITTNITHQRPTISLGSPVGTTVRRTGPGDTRQTFAMTVSSPHANNWTGSVTVTPPAGSGCAPVTDTFFGLKYRSGQQATSSPIALCHANGTYTVTGNATDTSGTSTAAANPVSGTFTYVWNSAPAAPSLIAPASGATIPEGVLPTFVIRADDPELDTYQGSVFARRVSDGALVINGLGTTQSASGGPAVAQAASALPAGQYEWQARATDQFNATGALSAWQPFTVSGAPSNTPPGVPTLVAPAAGKVFAQGEAQSFTVSATDADADGYVGRIEIKDGGGTPVSTFTTSQAASGQSSSGAPPVALGAGSYTWTAQAIDVRGGISGTSGSRSFSVAGNAAPGAPSLQSPANGKAYAQNELQLFTVRATDPEGDPYTARIEVDGQVACTTAATPSGQDASCAPLPQVGGGSHSWRAQAVDVNGNGSAWSTTRSFTVASNAAPGTPTLVRPEAGRVFSTGEPQLFGVVATDADGDPYSATVTATNTGTGQVRTFDTAQAPSGVESFGTPVPPLDPGSYTWTATARDAKGASGPASASRTLTVNRPPATPTLVSPANGATFGAGQTQTFTVTSADPDPGETYHGRVTVRNATGGVPVLVFDTAQVASGASSSGSPPASLPAGNYTWSAEAVDTHGGTSGVSGSRVFQVAGNPLDNQAPSAPTLVSPASGATFAFGQPESFTVRATDPNNEPYTATIEVTNTGTSAVTTFQTRPAPSGFDATGSPPGPLPAGSYSWRAIAVDLRGSPGPWSSSRTFTVTAI